MENCCRYYLVRPSKKIAWRLVRKFISAAVFISFLLISLILIAGLSSIAFSAEISLTPEEQAWLREHPDIKLGAPTSYPPLIIQNAKGPHTGMLVDLFDLINQRLNTNIQLHIEDSWSSVLEKAKNRSIDGLASGGRSASREVYLTPTDTLFSTYYYIFARTNDQLHLKSVKDLEGMRIGYKKADAPVKSLLDKYTGVTPVPYNDNLAMTKGLMNKEVDVLVAWISYDFWRRDKLQGTVDNILLATNNPLDSYIHIRKDWPELIAILNKVLSSIRQNELIKIMDKWFIARSRLPVAHKIYLTENEQAWLEKKQTIRVRVIDYPPYIIPKEGGEPSGIVIDYLELIAERTGVEFKYSSSDKPFNEALDGLKKHQGPDLISTIVSTPERKKSIFFSKDYLTSPYVIFMRADNKKIISGMSDLLGKKVALQKGSALHKIVETDYPDVNLMLFNHDIKAIEAVASGEADAYIGNMMMTSYRILNRGPYNLRIAAPSPFEDQRFSMGIRNDWPELASIIGKGLATITPQEQDEIRNRYISLRYEGLNAGVIVKWTLVIASIISGITLLFFLWNRSLAKKVKERTLSLENNKKSLEKEITERKQAEMEINRIFELSPDLIGVGNLTEGYYKRVNPAYKVFGRPLDEFLSRPYIDFIHPDDHDVTASIVKTMQSGQSIFGFENRYRCKDGSYRTIEWHGTETQADGTVYVVGRDITDRKEAEDVLRESEDKYKGLFNSIRDSILVTDTNRSIVDCNPAFTDLFGYSVNEIIGKKTLCLYENEIQFKELGEAINGHYGKSPFLKTVKYKKKNGDIFPGETGIYFLKNSANELVGFIGLIRDISERIKLRSQLLQAQKIESIGTLAGGIAHDFNNILYPIIGFTEMSIEELPDNNPVQENLDDILKGAKRARDLVKQILSFSSQRDLEQKALPLQPLIDETLKLLRSIIPSNIEIQKEMIEEQAYIFANTTEIHEIIMNLSTNAYHSMEENGGILKVSLNKEQPGSEHNLPLLREYCCLGVHDEGTGISPEIINDIFDPYFTTKEQGKGSGLGLSVIHGIIKSYKGAIDIQSKAGKGTLVKVYLPLSSKSGKIDEDLAPSVLPTGNEKILFVDDEASIVKLGIRILQRLGYTVIGKTNSREALELFISNPDDFDLVITDMTMPIFLGTDLAKKILKARQDIPILLCTGFSENIDKESAQSFGIKGYINKPILLKELATKVRELLDMEKE